MKSVKGTLQINPVTFGITGSTFCKRIILQGISEDDCLLKTPGSAKCKCCKGPEACPMLLRVIKGVEAPDLTSGEWRLAQVWS